MNKLAILESSVPIKAIPETELNTIILTTFLTWVCDLLSLTDETSAKRLKTAFPAIKKHCWSMGFAEIKKMFEMYADCELSVKPIPNYFDRILFGKIVEAYKQQKQRPKKQIQPIVLSDEEKRMNEVLSAAICFDYYIQNGYLNENSLYLYTVLFERKLFDFTDKEIEGIKKKATDNNKPIESQRVIFKKIMLTRFFDRLHAKGMKLNDVL